MTDVRWDLLQPVDVAGRFQQGYQNALAVRERQDDRALRQQQIEAQQVQQKQQQQVQLTERHQHDITLGSRLVRQLNPTDDASWQNVRAAAQNAGVDLTDVPEHFDANYVRQLEAAGQALEAQPRPQQPTTLQRNDEYIRGRYGNAAGDQYVQRQIAPPPITQHNADGTITIIPQAAPPLNQGGAPAAPQQLQQPVTMTPEQLTAQAEEAIRNGADPAAVNARLQQMLSRSPREAPAFRPAPGGPAPGQGNFPQ